MHYEIEDLIQAIEQFAAHVPTEDRELAFEESGLGDLLTLLKEGVALSATEEKGTDTEVDVQAAEGESEAGVADQPDVEA